MRARTTGMVLDRRFASECAAALLLVAGLRAEAFAGAGEADGAVEAAGAAASDLSTPEGVYARLFDAAAPRSATPEEYAAMLAVVDSASEASPGEARWVVARSVLERRLGNKGRAVELAEQAVKLDPASAIARCAYGTALFENINNVGMFSKMSVAGDGEAAYLKALELDPTLTEPRFGLVQFYANAPGIAGGSLKKARQHAQALVDLGGRWESSGHSLLAMVAAKDEDWEEAVKRHRLASEKATTARDRSDALGALGLMLVREKKDPAAALSVADEARALGVAEDTTADFVTGLARQQLKQYDLAVPAFREVIRKNPAAVNSRFALAECLEKTGDKAGAASVYEEFASKFPKDGRAADADSRAKKLRNALKK